MQQLLLYHYSMHVCFSLIEEGGCDFKVEALIYSFLYFYLKTHACVFVVQFLVFVTLNDLLVATT